MTDETLQIGHSADLTGKILGGYRLVTHLRNGGMGTVYYAEHTLIGRRAAIKVLHPEISRNPQVLSRFLIEARAANDIGHPNVVEITDIGQSGDVHYIVMSFLEGETLGERLERTKILEEDAVVRIVRQVASALAAAHDHGIVHRDLKPENIFLLNHPDYPDYVKVLDFGIARVRELSSGSNATAAGSMLGTPAFMAPEQALGRVQEIDAQSDLWSVGAMMFTLLTGEYVDNGETVNEQLVAAATQGARSLAELAPDMPKAVVEIVDRALASDKPSRWADAPSMQEAVHQAYSSLYGDTLVGRTALLMPAEAHGESPVQRALAPTHSAGPKSSSALGANLDAITGRRTTAEGRSAKRSAPQPDICIDIRSSPNVDSTGGVGPEASPGALIPSAESPGESAQLGAGVSTSSFANDEGNEPAALPGPLDVSPEPTQREVLDVHEQRDRRRLIAVMVLMLLIASGFGIAVLARDHGAVNATGATS